jgi:hypothetical protein
VIEWRWIWKWSWHNLRCYTGIYRGRTEENHDKRSVRIVFLVRATVLSSSHITGLHADLRCELESLCEQWLQWEPLPPSFRLVRMLTTDRFQTNGVSSPIIHSEVWTGCPYLVTRIQGTLVRVANKSVGKVPIVRNESARLCTPEGCRCSH